METSTPDKIKKGLERVPEHLRDGLELWIMRGNRHALGSFLRAVLSNDLMDAFMRGDEASLAGMADILSFLYSCAPQASHGSPARVHDWRGMDDSQ